MIVGFNYYDRPHNEIIKQLRSFPTPQALHWRKFIKKIKFKIRKDNIE